MVHLCVSNQWLVFFTVPHVVDFTYILWWKLSNYQSQFPCFQSLMLLKKKNRLSKFLLNRIFCAISLATVINSPRDKKFSQNLLHTKEKALGINSLAKNL